MYVNMKFKTHSKVQNLIQVSIFLPDAASEISTRGVVNMIDARFDGKSPTFPVPASSGRKFWVEDQPF
jgi:hypothetical protein